MRHVRALLSVAALLVALTAGSALGAEQPAQARPDAPTKQDEIARLRAEVERLIQQQARLEAEIARLAQAAGQADAAGRDALLADIVRLREELKQVAESARQAAASVEALSEADRRRVNLTVYGDFQATAYKGEDLIFDGRAFELVFSGQPHERLSFFSEVEFEQAAAVGEERGGEVLVEQAYANLQFSSLLNLRAGILLVPFGNVNVDHFAPRRDVVNKPIVSWVVAPSDWTDNGLGLHGSRLLGSSWLVSYEAYLVAGLDSQISAYGLRDARQGYGVDNNGNKAFVGRVALDRLGHVTLGLSGYRGKYDDANRLELEGWAVDSLIELSRLRLTGEYNSFKAEGEPRARYSGCYGRASLDVLKGSLRKSFLGRGFSEPRLTAVYQYDWVSSEGPLAGAWEHTHETRHTVGLNFRPSDNWVLKLDYEWNDTDNLTLYRGDRDGFIGAIAFVF